MIDFRDYVYGIMNQVAVSEKKEMQDIVAFFVDNSWFGSEPILEDGRVILDEERAKLYEEPLRAFLSNDASSETLLKRLEASFPATARHVKAFFQEESLDEVIWKKQSTSKLLKKYCCPN